MRPVQQLRVLQMPPHAQHSPQHAVQYAHSYGGAFEPAAPGWHRYDAPQHYGERAPLTMSLAFAKVGI